jgi:hypothetical protein
MSVIVQRKHLHNFVEKRVFYEYNMEGFKCGNVGSQKAGPLFRETEQRQRKNEIENYPTAERIKANSIRMG